VALLEKAIIVVHQEEGRKFFASCANEKLALGFIHGNEHYPSPRDVVGVFEIDELGRTTQLVE
jgi:hypothetical protein